MGSVDGQSLWGSVAVQRTGYGPCRWAEVMGFSCLAAGVEWVETVGLSPDIVYWSSLWHTGTFCPCTVISRSAA